MRETTAAPRHSTSPELLAATATDLRDLAALEWDVLNIPAAEGLDVRAAGYAIAAEQAWYDHREALRWFAKRFPQFAA